MPWPHPIPGWAHAYLHSLNLYSLFFAVVLYDLKRVDHSNDLLVDLIKIKTFCSMQPWAHFSIDSSACLSIVHQ